MKKRLTITMVGVLALGAMLLGLSCSPPAQNNTNTGPGNNAATINSNVSANSGAVAPTADPCTDPDKPGAVAKQLEDDIKANGKLRKQFEKKSFRFRIYPGLEPDSLHLFLAGVVGDPDGMGGLAAIIKKVGKKKCVERVFFVTDNVIPASAEAAKTALTSGRYFEWMITCQDPNIPCLGECKPADQCTAAVIPGANADINANANTNANKTSTTNSSSNSNSRPAVNRQ